MTKVCIVCGDEFTRPKGKSDKVWEKQRCCGKDCSAMSRRKETSDPKILKRRKTLELGGRRFSRSGEVSR